MSQMEPVQFRVLDQDGNGRLEQSELRDNSRKLSSLWRDTYGQATEQAYADQIEAAVNRIDDFDSDGDGDLEGDPYYSTGNGEIYKTKAYLESLKGFNADEFLNDQDENYWYNWYQVPVETVKNAVRTVLQNNFQKMKDEGTFADLGRATGFGINAYIAKNLPPEEDFSKPFIDLYNNKTIADIYENQKLYSAVTVSQAEYDRWKIFAAAAKDNLELDIYEGVLPKAEGGASGPTADNSELKAFVDAYGTNSRLDEAQQQKLENETLREKTGHGFKFMVDGKPAYPFYTSIITKPGFEWTDKGAFKFYELYDSYFRSLGLYK